MMILPLVFITVVARFPIGLLIYWMTTNLWTVGQGLVTRRLVPKTPAPPAPRRAGRAGARGRPRAASRRPRGGASPTPRRAPHRRRRSRGGVNEEGRRAPVSDDVSVEATGETVGEAKWKALRDLERLAPGPRHGERALPGRDGGRARPARRRLHAGRA